MNDPKTANECISCGMPLMQPKDHAAGDPSKQWCTHCSDEHGNLKPYDQILAGMTQFMVGSQGMDEGVARQAAQRMLATMPAWKDRAVAVG